MSQAIEVVIFKAKAGVSDAHLRTKAAAVTAILRSMTGFVDRKLGVSENGQYLDIVYWKDPSTAKAAADKAMQIPECLEYFGLIEESQMQFMHFTTIE